jgi:uncharacterized membrane protein
LKHNDLGVGSGRSVERFAKGWGFIIIFCLGFAVRFWNLDLKPLWLDETITLLFASGHRYEDIPRETLLSLSDLAAVLHWYPQSCLAIAQSVSTQSTHPPLFFCLLHQWLGMLHGSGLSLRWQVRSLPALFGVVEIAAMYGLNRAAFSPRAGFWAAALMAVSPFAVYLSQEARHYTLPMLVMTLSMIPLVRLVQGMDSHQPQNPWRWLAWVALNSLGFYIHYFCVLAFVAQAVTLLGTIVRLRQWHWLVGFGTAIGALGLSFLPWLPFMLGHAQRSETGWLRFDGGGLLDWLGPIARLLAGAIITVVMLPVEEQPLGIAVANGLVLLAMACFLTITLSQQIPRLLQGPQTASGTRVVGGVLVVILAEYLLLVYGFHKDLTLAPRYGFVFFPMLCALVAASLSELSYTRRQPLRRLLPWALIGMALVGTGCVVNNVAFLKPFQPQRVAERFLETSDPALVVLQTDLGNQDIALGVSSALAVQQFQESGQGAGRPQTIRWGFVEDAGANPLTAQSLLPAPVKLWRVGAIHSQTLAAAKLTLSLSIPSIGQADRLNCSAQPPALSELGVRYQSFRCDAVRPR